MAVTQQSATATIEQFLATVGAVKVAEQAHTETGGYDGPTTHQIKNVPDNTEKAKEGARSAENEKDVKKQEGPPAVDNTPQASAKAAALRLAKLNPNPFLPAGAKAGGAADDAVPSPLNPQPTGQTPELETGGVKAKKEDHREGERGGTKHPASTENDALNGGKYAEESLEKMAQALKTQGDELCAWIANYGGAPASQPAKTAAAAAPPAPITDPRILMQAGNEIAGLLNGTMDKQAADAMVQRTLEEVIKTASDDAVRVVNWLSQVEAAQKQAAGMPPEMAAPGGGPDGGAGAGGGGDPSAMLAALGGGQAAEGGAGGAMPGGAMPGGEAGHGAGGGEEQEVMAIAQLLDQLGITPEEIAQAMQAESGGGGAAPAAAPPKAAAAATPAPATPPATAKQADAQTGDVKASVTGYITELVKRSRANKAAAAA